jgi:hypothetical protein
VENKMAENEKNLWQILTEEPKKRKANLDNFFKKEETEKVEENNEESEEVISPNELAQDIILGIYQAKATAKNWKIKDVSTYRKELGLEIVTQNYQETDEKIKDLNFDYADGDATPYLNAFIIASINKNKILNDEGEAVTFKYSEILNEMKKNGFSISGLTEKSLEGFYQNTEENVKEYLDETIINARKKSIEEKNGEDLTYEDLASMACFQNLLKEYFILDYMKNGTNERVLDRLANETADHIIEFFKEKLRKNDDADQQSMVNAINLVSYLSNESLEPKTYKIDVEPIANEDIGRFNTEESFNELYKALFPDEEKA